MGAFLIGEAPFAADLILRFITLCAGAKIGCNRIRRWFANDKTGSYGFPQWRCAFP
jgi:hypothetical protein